MAVVKSFTRFIDTAPGTEKALRLIQAIVQILAAYTHDAALKAQCLSARGQIAVGRRYFRYFKFINSFQLAWTSFTAPLPHQSPILEAAKWSFMGFYLFLEAFTIMDAMGLWQTAWGPKVFLEANKFWMYAIICSLMISFRDLLLLLGVVSITDRAPTPTPTTTEKESDVADEVKEDESLTDNEKKTASTTPAAKDKAVLTDTKTKTAAPLGITYTSVAKRAVTDACDFFLPGTATGLISASSGFVGILSVISTLIPASDIWVAANSS